MWLWWSQAWQGKEWVERLNKISLIAQLKTIIHWANQSGALEELRLQPDAREGRPEGRVLLEERRRKDQSGGDGMRRSKMYFDGKMHGN